MSGYGAVVRRTIILALGIALIGAACGDAGSATTTVTAEVPTEAPDTPADSSPPASAGGVPLPDDAVAAPDFELALGDGGSFQLSDTQKPVYLVFWAEW